MKLMGLKSGVVGVACAMVVFAPPVAAGPPMGTCCLDATTCIITDARDCFLQGGQYLGDFIDCSVCFPCVRGAGDCCEANGTPSCDEGASDCCFHVCGIDPFCCEVEWDGICVALAQEFCGDLCPPTLTISWFNNVIPPRVLEAFEHDPLGTWPGVQQDQRMNVGVPVQLVAFGTGPQGGMLQNVQWTIPGMVIKDYSIASARDAREGFLTECTTIPLLPRDLQDEQVFYHYTETGVSTVMVSALVDGVPLTASRTFDVERHPKAEIFYATGPGGINDDTAVEDRDNVIGEHLNWHKNIEPGADAGEFFRFHRGFIQKFDCWRGIFGGKVGDKFRYPCVKVYATAANYVPAGPEVDHAGTPGDGNGIIDQQRENDNWGMIYELPLMFTIAGGLANFATEDILSSSILTYHNDHHELICHTGDFTPPKTTPADPIFWRFHFMLSKVFELWQFLKLNGQTIMVDATGPGGAQVFYPDMDLVVETDCSDPIVQACNHPSGSMFPIGMTTVQCTVKDVMKLDDGFPLNSGTMAKIEFIVTVNPDPFPWDCGDNDGSVGIIDFLALLAEWGQVDTPCDFDGGGVGINDFLALLAHWGPEP